MKPLSCQQNHAVTYVLLGSGTVIVLVLGRLEKVHVEDLQKRNNVRGYA